MRFTSLRGPVRALALLLCAVAAGRRVEAAPRAAVSDGDVAGTVTDSATGKPLPGGEVRVLRGSSVIAAATTDAFGRYVIHNLPAGDYTVEIRFLGYRPGIRAVTVAAAEQATVGDFRLAPIPIIRTPAQTQLARCEGVAWSLNLRSTSSFRPQADDRKS